MQLEGAESFAFQLFAVKFSFKAVPSTLRGESCFIVCLIHLMLTLLINIKQELVLRKDDFGVISTLAAKFEGLHVLARPVDAGLSDCGLSHCQHPFPGALCAE